MNLSTYIAKEWSEQCETNPLTLAKLLIEIKGATKNSSKSLNQALKSAPELVNLESSPARFLLAERHDKLAAARRLALYWQERKALFQDKAYMPMTATGHGALKTGDLEVLRSGVFFQLPDDSSGRIVFGYDRCRLDNDFDDAEKLTQQVLRCAFYVVTVASRKKKSQSCVLLNICESSFRPSSVDLEITQGIHRILDIGPFRHETTTTVVHVGTREKDCALFNVMPSVQATIEACVSKDKLSFVVACSKTVLLSQLQCKGFAKAGIPVTIGGSWGYFKSYNQWIRQRFGLDKLVEATFNGDLMKVSEVIQEEEAIRRKRKLDVIYAKRQRVKNKGRKDHLRKTVEGLREEKANLQREHERLQALKVEALKLVNKDSPKQSSSFLPSDHQLAQFNIDEKNVAYLKDAANTPFLQLPASLTPRASRGPGNKSLSTMLRTPENLQYAITPYWGYANPLNSVASMSFTNSMLHVNGPTLPIAGSAGLPASSLYNQK